MIDETMKTPHLEIRLLGPVEILYNQKSIKIPRKIERAILYYLAIENRSVSRSDLIDLLWPQAEQVDPRGALRTALSRLRKQLPDASLIHTELDQVALDASRVAVDLIKFKESFVSLRGVVAALPSHNPLPVPIVNQIKEGLALWHGDTVLEGDDLSVYPELDSWRFFLSRELTLQREFMSKRLATHYRASGQLELAMDQFIALGHTNHLDVDAHLAVIEILITLGRHQEALEYCDVLEVIFEREFNAPLPDELAQRCWYAQTLIEASEQRRSMDWPLPSSMHLPLVGRTDVLGQLRLAYFQGGLIKIQGETGIGKTRLVQELFETLSPKPMLILAPARESESTLPLAPLIHAFRRHIPEDVWLEVDAVWAHQLARLFPELVERRADIIISGDGLLPAGRQPLFDAVYRLLSLAAKRYGRMLFFLDDAQWADQLTLELVSYLLMQGLFSENGVLILALQNDNGNQAVDELIAQRHHNQPVQVVDLHGLNPDEVRILAEQILSQPPTTTLTENLFRETNGNPLWVQEILLHLLETPGEVDQVLSTGNLPLPISIHALIRQRLNRLSGESHYILTCAALLGNDISIRLLNTVVNIHPQEFFSALNPLIQSGFLHTHQAEITQEDTLYFTHEKIRDVVVAETAPIYRQILHQQIAQVLSQDPHAVEQAALIADHYSAGCDVSNAFQWYLQAAAHAWSLGASKDVIYSFEQAENLVNDTQGNVLSQDDIFELYHQWSTYAFQSNQIQMLEGVGVKLQHYAKTTADPLMMGTANLALSNACFLRGDFDTSQVLYEKAVLDLVIAGNHTILLNALFHQALLYWWTLDLDKIFLTADRMIEVLSTLEPQSPVKVMYEFNARRMVSEAYYAQGDARSALEFAQSIFQEYLHQLDTFNRLRAFNMMAHVHLIAGNIDASISYAQQGLKTAQTLENTFVEELLLIVLCKAKIIQCRLDEAFEYASQVQKFAEINFKLQTTVSANTLLGDIFFNLHDYKQAEQHYRIAQVRQGYTFQSYNGLENNIYLTYLLTMTGQDIEARELIQSTLAVVDAKGLQYLHTQALMADGYIDLLDQNLAAAETKYIKSIEIAEDSGLAHQIIWGRYHLALIAFHRQEFTQAEEYLVQVIKSTQANGMILLLQYALALAAQLLKMPATRLDPDEIRMAIQTTLEYLEAQTQSPPLREAFLHTQRYWQEFWVNS
jgi:hypothetical protein